MYLWSSEQVQSTKHFSLNILISFSGSTSMQDEAVDQWFLKLEDRIIAGGV